MTASRVLVVGPAWVGDMVMAGGLVQVLKARAPDMAIDILAPPATAPIAALMPGVRDVIESRTGHGRLDIGARWSLGRSLRQRRYELAIVLPRSFKSALVPFFARVPRRRGYRGEMRYGLLTEALPDIAHGAMRTVDKFVRLAGADEPSAAPMPVLDCAADKAAEIAARFGLDGPDDDASLIALCPGAEYGPAKQWPHFKTAAALLADKGYRIMVVGSPKERDISAEIAAAASNAVTDLTGRTTLSEAVHLLSRAHGVITNDSGLMHVACALDRPVVALFGSSSADITPPLGKTVTVLERTLDCRPCFARQCPLGHLDCLTTIPATEAVAALEAVLRDE